MTRVLTGVRVCMVVPYDLAEAGGVKHHAFQLAGALRALGDEVEILGASSRRIPDVHAVGGIVNIPSNGSDNRLAILASPRRIRRWLAAHAFDVIHVHEPLCPMLGPWAVLLGGAAARVGTFHAYAEREELVPRVMRVLGAPLVLPRLHRAIAVSSPAAAYARVVWKRELAIIPNGIALDRFTPGDRRAPGGPVRLLFVGQWRDARKGLATLLDAFARLRARGHEITLDVVGNGPAHEPPPRLPGVSFHGVVSDVAPYLQRCDVFVAPATGQESFGIVLLEAMACGRAIACSDIAGYRQVVGPENARLVPPGDVERFADAIAELAGSPQLRAAMGAANVERARTFAWSSLVHRVRAVYEEAITACC